MRISDWSSDVCFSDLQLPPKRAVGGPEIERAGKEAIDRAQPDEQLPDHVVAQERMSMKTLRRPVAAQPAQTAIKRLGDIHASAMTRQWPMLNLSTANACLRPSHGRSRLPCRRSAPDAGWWWPRPIRSGPPARAP